MFLSSSVVLKQIFLFFCAVQAQVVTSSFDTTVIGENPASAATRIFGVATPFVSYTQINQEIKDVVNNESFTWNRKLKIQRYEAIYAGKKTQFVPEIYISQNYGNKEISMSSSDMKTKNDVTMLNKHFNLGISLSERIKIGIKFFQPSMSYKVNERYVLVDSTVRTFNSDFTFTEMGTGGGATIFITRNFSIGGFYTSIEEKLKGKSTYKEGTNDPIEDESNSTSTIIQSGAGLAYQLGNSRSKGLRIELSWASMKFPYEGSPPNNTQGRLSLEASNFGFTGGVSLVQKTGRYINYRYFIDSVLADDESLRPIITYGGFLGFKTKSGSSLNGFANYSSGKSNISLFDSEQPGRETKLYVGLGYAYNF